tara:strand:+ start:610 stop:1257 length:648 start_codon:yes stop_codon:yes gene_type:complete
MPTKTKDKSPIKNDPFASILGSSSGMGPSQSYAGGAVSTGSAAASGAASGFSGAGALGATGGAIGGIIDQFNTDPTAKGAVAGTATSEALKYGAMGAALGPIGAGVGAALGLGIGIVKGRKAKKAAEEAEKARKKAEAEKKERIRVAGLQSDNNAQLAQNMVGASINPYDLSPLGMFTKKLKSIKGLIPANMSAAQYKSGLKMQEISGVNTLSNY